MTTKAPLGFYSAIFSTLILLGCGGGSSSSDETTPIEEPVISDPVSNGLVINEIVAKANDDGNDWFELYVTTGSVDLSNFSVVDDNAEHSPQPLPDVTLNEGEYIVIYAIDEAQTPPENAYSVAFKLGSEDALTLYEGESIVDQLSWQEGDAPEGYSFGLEVDGGVTTGLLTPTLGASNVATSVEQPTVDTLINEHGAIRINEIVAKDINDGFDWIEFYVSGDESISLADYSIADEQGVIYSLPEAQLASGEFYRVYATDELDTNLPTVAIKLGAKDVLSLYLDTDLVDKLEWSKGDALYGTSYGRFPDGSDRTETLTPTAGLNNVLFSGPDLLINEVVASQNDDSADWFELYNNSSQPILLSAYQVIDESDDISPVTLPEVSLDAGQHIVIYATDESIDDYSVAFKLGKNDELNLIKNEQVIDFMSWQASEVSADFSYGLIESGIKGALSTLTPTPNANNAVAEAFHRHAVNNLYINIDQDEWQDLLNYPLLEEYHPSSLTYNGINLDTVGFRTKGGSSLEQVARSSSERYSFKVDINEYVDDQMLFGLKKFVLQNSFNDPSYMREIIAYDLLEDMGVPTPRRGYVNLYINDEHYGLYLMVEVIDSAFIAKHFANANGDLYKPDGEGSDLVWVGDDLDYYSDINPKLNEDSTDHGAFLQLVEQLDEGNIDSVNIDTFLRYMAVSVALSNLDSYHGTLAHNYYLYEDDGAFTLLPWDFNESFGTFSMNCRSDVRALYIDEPTSGYVDERPLVASVFANEEHLNTYHNYLWELINGPLADDQFPLKVEEIDALINQHVAEDDNAFYGYDYYQENLHDTVGQFYGLTSFMTYRIRNMQQQLTGTIKTGNDGRGYCQ